MGRLVRPRSELRGRRHFQPEFGARHPLEADIEGDRRVGAFFNELDRRWAEILPEREPEDQALTGLPERRFKLYDNPDKIGIPVVERRVFVDYARRRRIQWNANDAGRLRGRLEDQISRLDIDDSDLNLTLTTAIRIDEGDRGGRFALVPEADDPAAELLVAENEIIVAGLNEVFVNFSYPGEYTPQMGVGRVYKDASSAQVDACEAELHALIAEQPLTVPLDWIAFK